MGQATAEQAEVAKAVTDLPNKPRKEDEPPTNQLLPARRILASTQCDGRATSAK